MSRKAIEITDRYLQIPVRVKQENKVPLHFYCDGEKILELAVCVGNSDWKNGEFDYYGQLPMPAYQGKRVEIEGEVPEGFLAKICCGDAFVANTEKRPAYHFTPNVGWMNDPNGLVYKDGIYHFYFQHNPVDREWENMSWGHAVSTDLLHWTYKDIAMLPEADGTIYSGCAMINEHAALGYPADAILAFYTVAGGNNVWSKGKKFVQKVAVSCDGGEILKPLEIGVLPTIEDYNRDPNVFWHEESKGYVMVLWIDGFDFGIFRSADLVTWEETQRITLPEGYECPNMRQLYTEDGSDSIWMIFDAAGSCYTGEFDGYTFKWSGKIQKLFHREYASESAAPYAAQLYANTPGRCILVPWLTTADTDKKYHCSAGLPRELYVRKEEDESFTVCQKPVAEYEAARECAAAENASECTLTLNGENAQLTVLAENGEDLTIAYESNGILFVGEKQYTVACDASQLRVITDDRIVEIFVEDTEYILAELSDSACGFSVEEEYEVQYWKVN